MICALAAGLAMAACEPDVAGPAMRPIDPWADCPAGRSLYELHLDADRRAELTSGPITAGFVPARHYASVVSDLYFWVETTQGRYWFVITLSMGYSVTEISPVTDPTRADAETDGPREFEAADGVASGSTLLLFDADGMPAEIPSSGDAGPEWILVPDLGPVLWYSPGDVTDRPASERDRLPTAFFRRSGCADEAPAPAWP